MQPTSPDAVASEAPLRLGPFLVDQSGRLSPADDAPPCFTLRWRDRSVRAELRHVGEEGALALGVMVGKVPSSVEVGRAEAGRADSGRAGPRRDAVFSALRALPKLLPAPWRVALLPDHHICLLAEEAIALPVSAVGLLTGLSAFLLTLGPYLDLLEGQGTALPARSLATAP